jgi:pimeloyl-ACP methyl ester carboxylesterase
MMVLRRGITAGLLVACAILACAVLTWPNSVSANPHRSGSRGGTHLYVFLGLGNQSPGLAEFGRKMQRRGIPTTIANHTEEPALVEDAIRRYRSGLLRSVKIVGHSLGGRAAGAMAIALSQAGVPVQLVVALDPTGGALSLPHVRRAVNFFPRSGEDHFTVIAAHERDMTSYVLGGR